MRAGGYGASDLYCSQMEDDGRSFSAPLNLGPAINTAGDEFHYMEDKEGFIHFVSSGHAPKANQVADIFYTRADGKGGYLKPTNPGASVNGGGGQGDAGVLDICTAMVTPDGKRMAFYSMLSPPTADNPLGDMDILTVDRVY